MQLPLPLTVAQVEAAIRLFRRLDGWFATDEALFALADAFPGFDLRPCLLKVAALNQLYATQVYAVFRMAEHASRILSGERADLSQVELVERLAALPRAPGQRRERRHISFASKFLHFFLNAERFPIYDWYADRMVRLHLGWERSATPYQHPYRAFVANLHRLRQHAGLECSGRDLDRYLWLAGQYREWTKNRQATINTELRRLFDCSHAEVQRELALLMDAAPLWSADNHH